MAAAVAAGETGERQHLDYELLKALQRGDKKAVESFFPQEDWRGVTGGGNSALHIAADFGHREFAELICARDSSLLEARNVAGETPLHCAARAGADQIVSLFISEAKRREDGSWLEAVLRATDREGKTALHSAVEGGHAAAARVLMSEDPGLAAIVDNTGVSPLYAAVLSNSLQVVQVLIGFLAVGEDTPEECYAGPNKQTALHAAAMIGNPMIVKILLLWKPMLTKKVDNSKSTPLHYLAEAGSHYMMRQLLEHDTSPAYLSDSEGLCSIHVAARNMGRLSIIRELINSCPDMSELVDGGGRNFLHVAIQHESKEIVRFVCSQPFLSKMMNARDSEGNTPLHLAVKSKNQTTVRLLLENMSVHPSIVNKDGKTPLDLAVARVDLGLNLQKDNWIYRCLKGAGAIRGSRQPQPDHLTGESLTEPDLKKELKAEQETYKNAPQNLIVASVLIATVTFAAAFTMPGGYIADDHRHGGSPTLAGKYAFNVFIIADTLAFTYSVQATLMVMYAGSHVVDPSRRFAPIRDFIAMAALLMVAAFAMTVYVLLAPLSKSTAILCCAMPLFFTLAFLSSWAAWQPFFWPLY
uniref:PGG domain-containing protein n=1 Tax=Ananas comosus var. bracteatus TaxID=296719 RepID=A0A6V7PJQ8_ANACO|nr:unnamed protein product [Ananas comosus var. bracteatus]